MAVRHDKCRAPSLFLPSRRVVRIARLQCRIRALSRLGDRQPAMELERAMGVNYAVLWSARGDFRVRDRSQGWSHQRCGAIRWPNCSFASQARWE